MGCKEGHSVNEGVDEDFIAHVLVLIDDIAVGLAYLVDFVGVVTDDIEKPVYLLLVLDFEVVATSEESDVYLLFILFGVKAETKPMSFEF